jgi:hypothetical protein
MTTNNVIPLSARRLLASLLLGAAVAAGASFALEQPEPSTAVEAGR